MYVIKAYPTISGAGPCPLPPIVTVTSSVGFSFIILAASSTPEHFTDSDLSSLVSGAAAFLSPGVLRRYVIGVPVIPPPDATACYPP